NERERAGMLIVPLTSERPRFPTVSFVAAEPPSSVSCVSDESRVRAMELPGDAEPERVNTRWATRFPGDAALRVKGIGFVDSLNVARREIAPADEGLNSDVGVSPAVMPARVKVTAETAAAGE